MLQKEVADRKGAKNTLQKICDDLEKRLDERTAELSRVKKQLRKELAERQRAQEQFRRLVESVPNGMIIINREGKIVLINTQTEKMFGYSRQELIGQSVEKLVPQRFRDQHPGYRKLFFTHPESRSMGAGRDLNGLRKDGTEFPVEIGLNPIETEEGVMVLSALVDISARKHAEEALAKQTRALAHSNEELEHFAYLASHDLQEPLRMINSYLELLQQRYQHKLDATAQEFIGFAVDGAGRMRALIQGLLQYSRVGTHAQPFEPIDCEAVFENAITNLKIIIADSGAVVTHDPLPEVLADSTQLIQLFQNLIGNAIKFRTDKRPEVHVVANAENGCWRFSVRDNGIGVAPEHQERIFLIFQRLHTRDERPGTGMGLAICKKIVERHGGRIWVESELGKGSVFYFTIPNQ